MSEYFNATNDPNLCKSINRTTNLCNPTYPHITRSPIMTIPPNDSRIDTETHTITQICFSLAFCSTLIHLAFILYFKRIRQLYGLCIMIHCFYYAASYFTILLTCCSLARTNHLIHLIFGYLADYCILTTIMMNLKSSALIVYSLLSNRLGRNEGDYYDYYHQLCYYTTNNNSVCLYGMRKLCHIMGNLLVFSAPILCILLSWCLFEPNHYISEDHKEFAVISCNLIPNYGHFYIFFPIILFLLFIQFICMLLITKLVMTQYQSTENTMTLMMTTTTTTTAALWKTSHLNTRYWITLKFTLTHSLVWFIAFLALIQASITLWHVFTLLYSLQAIYITVNCTFTRPVLDLLYQWHEEKVDDYHHKHEQNLLMNNNHILPGNQLNDERKQCGIRNISINL